jgi:hypothetical protein
MAMKKTFFILIGFAVFFAVAAGHIEAQGTSLKDSYANGHLITRPENGSLVVIGVANPQSKKEKALALALEDAARKVAFFYGIRGRIATIVESGSGRFDFYSGSESLYDYDMDLQKYQDMLIFDPNSDVLIVDGAVIVRAIYQPLAPLNIEYSYMLNNGRPEWITRPPVEISGYLVGVGFARPQKRKKDALEKSYKNAVDQIVAQLSSTLGSSHDLYESSRNGTRASGSNVQISEAEIREFFILETWIDPKTTEIWTLTVAKRK